MTKQEFLEELSTQLAPLPEMEREKACAFYAEMIDDRMDDGIPEEQAVKQLGSMQEIVDRIIAETPITTLIKARVHQKRKSLLLVLCLVFGFPLWFPLLVTAVSVLLVMFLLLWVFVLVCWAVLAAFAAAAVANGIMLFIYPGFSVKMLLLGGALFCGGCTIPVFFVSMFATKMISKLTRRLWKSIKNCIFRKRSYDV